MDLSTNNRTKLSETLDVLENNATLLESLLIAECLFYSTTVLGAEDIVVNKTDLPLCFRVSTFYMRIYCNGKDRESNGLMQLERMAENMVFGVKPRCQSWFPQCNTRVTLGKLFSFFRVQFYQLYSGVIIVPSMIPGIK